MPPSDKNLAKLKFRHQTHQKIVEIKSYIDEQRGNEPEDLTGLKVIQKVFTDIERI